MQQNQDQQEQEQEIKDTSTEEIVDNNVQETQAIIVEPNQQQEIQEESKDQIPQEQEEEQNIQQQEISLAEYMQNQILQNVNLIIEQFGNDAFLQQSSLNAIAEFLRLFDSTPLDDIIVDGCQNKDKLDQILSGKKKELEKVVYDSLNLQGNLNTLEYIMKILKSKTKKIIITKQENQMLPHFHSHECSHGQVDEEKIPQPEKNDEPSEIKQDETPSQEKEIQLLEEDYQIQQNNNEQIYYCHKVEVQEGQENKEQQVVMNFKVKEQEQQVQENKEEQVQEYKEEQAQENKEEQQAVMNFIKYTQKISYSDLVGIMSLKSLNLDWMENYNPNDNSLVFKMHDVYRVQIIGEVKNEKRFINEDSLFSPLPQSLIIQNVFPYFSALELFKLRIICGEWKDLQQLNNYQNKIRVKQAWHTVFRREMFDQLYAKELQENIKSQSTSLTFRRPFLQKIGQLIHAMIKMINWEHFLQQVDDREIDIKMKKIVLLILKLLGHKKVEFDNAHNYEEINWELNIDLVKNLPQNLEQINSNNYPFPSKQQIIQIKQILSNPDFDLQNVSQNDQLKLNLYLTILANQLQFYILLRSAILTSQFYIERLYEDLEILQSRQSPNKNFLEGAYKILLLKTSVLKDGQVQQKTTQVQDEFSGGEEDSTNDKKEDEIPSTAQFLESLTRINPNNTGIGSEPDIVLKSKKTKTLIYIDAFTKFDILLSSMYQGIQNEQQSEPTQTQTEEQGKEQNSELQTPQKNDAIIQTDDTTDQATQQQNSQYLFASQTELNEEDQNEKKNTNNNIEQFDK